MKVSHEEYLKRMLQSKKTELEALNMDYRIAVEGYKVKQEMITKQIYSIENQLENNKG